MARALAAGVAGMLGVAVDLSDVPELLRIAASYPGHVWVSAGCHPVDVVERGAVSYDKLLSWAALPEVVAVGETGLDFHRRRSSGTRVATSRRAAALRKVTTPAKEM